VDKEWSKLFHLGDRISVIFVRLQYALTLTSFTLETSLSVVNNIAFSAFANASAKQSANESRDECLHFSRPAALTNSSVDNREFDTTKLKIPCICGLFSKFLTTFVVKLRQIEARN
jgi:hypothetical protein